MGFRESVLGTISDERLIDPGDRVLVGVSGGIDSSTLFFVLGSLREVLSIDLAIAHVNHGLRNAESERDEDFVRVMAEASSVPFHLLREDVKEYSRKQGISVQHAGRNVRYAFFARLAADHGYQKIAVAHNADDQVETFFLRIVKGTGINGLSSISIKRGSIIRPFLHSYRSEILAYARQHSVAYVEDSSNLKNAYERNFIRHSVTPLLEGLNPRFREKVLHLLADVTSVNRSLNRRVDEFLSEQTSAENEEIKVPIDSLRGLDEEVRFRVLSRLLSRLEPRFIALRNHINLVEKSLASPAPNSMVVLPQHIKVKRTYDWIVFTRRDPPKQVSEVFSLSAGNNSLPAVGLEIEVSILGRKPEALPLDRLSAILDGDRIGRLTVRTFREGDRFVPLGMEQSVKLKNYFISRKIHRERRRSMPLLLSDDDIAWVIGERIDGRFKVTSETNRFVHLKARLTG
jgi:tRNA(Ile)-lysidine synthase